MTVNKFEVAIAAAIKWFREMVASTPECGCGECPVKERLTRELEQLESKADGLLRDLFEEALTIVG